MQIAKDAVFATLTLQRDTSICNQKLLTDIPPLINHGPVIFCEDGGVDMDIIERIRLSHVTNITPRLQQTEAQHHNMVEALHRG